MVAARKIRPIIARSVSDQVSSSPSGELRARNDFVEIRRKQSRNASSRGVGQELVDR